MKRRFVLHTAFALGLSTLLAATPSPSAVADAAINGERDAVRGLLKQGADVGAAQGDGMTALHWAAGRGAAEAAQMLIDAGANVAAVTGMAQSTPLHLASRGGSAPLVAAL